MKLAQYVFTILGLIMLSAAGFFGYRTEKFVREALPAEGRVVDLASISSRDLRGWRTVSYAPIIEFNLAGETIRFESNISSSPPSYQKGDFVPVLYRASNPKDAEINSSFRLWFATVMLGGFGLVFFAAGFGLFLAERSKKSRNYFLIT